jgi:L-cysteine:1D-myo-inositol 2-amino-2-deoxy-alpha-D-glucopyranoside ligase
MRMSTSRSQRTRGSVCCPDPARPPNSARWRWLSSLRSAAATPTGPGRRIRWIAWCGGRNGPAHQAEYLGPVFDVQAGGVDLVFPHHEMSASHARVALAPVENAFARVYAHAGMVSYQGEKMSKSLGNLVFVSRLLADGVDPMAIRMSLLAHHYRSDWEWTDAVLGDGQARLARWRSALARAEAAVPYPDADSAPAPMASEAEFGGREAELGGREAELGGREAEFGAPGSGPASGAVGVLAGVRARLRDDLDAPGALSIVDRWADSLLAKAPWITPQDVSGARLVKEIVDARLGITL